MNRNKSKSAILALAMLLSIIVAEAKSGFAATLRVPEDFISVQAAITAAASGDTVMVAPGRYQENLKIYDKTVNLVSAEGPENTILDGNGLDAVVAYYGTLGSPKLDGFTVTNGSRSGIFINKARPEINNCIVFGNRGWVGGGVYALSGACPVIITNSEISGNLAQDQGGGIAANQACIWVRRSQIRDNSAGRAGGGIAGVGFCGGVSVEQSRLEGNSAGYYGGAAYSAGSNRCPPGIWSANTLVVNNAAKEGGGFYQGSYGRSDISQSTVSQNLAEVGGGFMGLSQSAYYRIVNTILYHNSTLPVLPETTVFGYESIVAGSDVEGGISQALVGFESNICADPKFVDAPSGDFSLASDSPCIDSGVTTLVHASGSEETLAQAATDLAGNLRVQGEGIDIGAFESSLVNVNAVVQLAPQVINLKSQGQWITAMITLPAPYRAEQVAFESILLNGAIPVEKGGVVDGKLVVKFDRELLIEYLESFAGPVNFYVRGEMPGVAVFQGSAEVRVLPRQVKSAGL